MSLLKLKSLAITADDTAAPLSATNLWVSAFTIQNTDAANTAYAGDSDVTDANGFKIASGGAFGMDNLVPSAEKARLINLKDIYVVCATGDTATLRVAYVVETF